MKMRYLAAAILFLGLVGFAWALVPPPPANQLVGFYDTSVNQLNDPSFCRVCHNSTYLGGVPTRHHMLVPTGEYGCTSCHPVVNGTNGQGALIDRNCLMCHNGSAFYANPSLMAGRPHHNTTFAQQRNCEACHGGVVDSYNDGHYVPTYAVSIVTPDTSFKIFNATSGRYWGGCEACHQADLSATPNILSNVDSHHNEIFGVTAGYQCTWCHISQGNALDIRRCEDCHSVATIHNIQYNYTQTNGQLGYGHIGTNWDCNGCHAFWDAGAANPFPGPTVLGAITVTPLVLTANQATVVTITSSNLIQTGYTSTVKLDGNDLITVSLTDSEIVANVPALTAGKHTIQIVKAGATDSTASSLAALTVVSPLTITSATLTSGAVTIVGTGFGAQPAQNANQYVTIKKANGLVVYSDSITSWSATQIDAASAQAAAGDIVTVTTGSGAATATITGGTVVDSLTVTYPNAAEVSWKRGTSKTVTWDRAGSSQAANVKIELMQGTSVKRTLASITLNDGSQSVTIPSKQATGAYTIRVTSLSHNPTYTDSSDNTFQVTR